MPAYLLSGRCGEGNQPSFRRRIERVERPGLVCELRSSVDDAAVAAFSHMWNDVLHAEEGATQIYLHHLLEALGRFLQQHDVATINPGVVDQNIEVAEVRDGSVNRGPHLFLIADIHFERHCLASEAANLSQQTCLFFLVPEIPDGNISPLGSEDTADRPANACARSND